MVNVLQLHLLWISSLARKRRYLIFISIMLLIIILTVLNFVGFMLYTTSIGHTNSTVKILHTDYWSKLRVKGNNQQLIYNNNDDDDDDDDDNKDWHDYVLIAKESKRRGIGEQGKAVELSTIDYVKERQSIKETGFNAVLSAAISVNRALPDVRHKDCLKRRYRARLPSTSIIIIFHNEQLSVLLRTVHSIVKRTPFALLKEIILVDDKSDQPNLYEALNIMFKVKLLHLSTRHGLIRARLAGARSATGDVLIFLDAHVEATVNWLPPLLEPIALDWRTSTTPIIDTIHYDTFAYVPQEAPGTRGHFNWQFNYIQLPLLPEEKERIPEPHNNPVMNGGLFAIAAKFFWHLGAYDDQLEIWGAEQFELSFKIWMCGGHLLEVPCSRLGHLYRDPNFQIKHNRSDDFISRNYKRVAEVWMDEYKHYLYEHIPKLTQIDAGDLSLRHALRQKLHCKPFKWFLAVVAPDLLFIYPPIEPPDFAFGALQSVAAPNLCLDAVNRTERRYINRLSTCAPDLIHPYINQYWSLSFRHELRAFDGCLELQQPMRSAVPQLWPCHFRGGNQYWFYDRQSQMLVNGKRGAVLEPYCLEADISTQTVSVSACEYGKITLRWHFGYVNNTAMDAKDQS